MKDPAGYSCEVCTDAGAWRLTLGGEFDLATVPVSEAVLRMAQADALTVWLDLGDVSFIDSSGIAMLMRAHQRADRAGNELVLVAPSAPVRRLLELCGIDRALRIEDRDPWTHQESGRRHAVIATNLDGVVVHWNRDAEAFYGYTAQHAVGRAARDLIVAPGDNDEARRIVQTLRTDGRWQGAFEVARADGSTFRAWVRDIVMCDDAGRPSGLLGLSVPMLELARAQPAPHPRAA
ncbi:MAG: anti-sigma factor antagonist [Actinobacteria bacterium]|nr:MAG: anti-sigma factor antagonist [Actinomycetota bacterium]